MPLMKSSMSVALEQLFNLAAPDDEVEGEKPLFVDLDLQIDELAIMSAEELADELTHLNHSASDHVTESHYGDPFTLCAALEAFHQCPIAVTTTVINGAIHRVPVEINQGPTTPLYPQSLCDALLSEPSELELALRSPPRWIGQYAFWKEAATVWLRAGRSIEADNSTLHASLSAFKSQFPKFPLLSYLGVSK